jgi:hypothetical protein
MSCPREGLLVGYSRRNYIYGPFPNCIPQSAGFEVLSGRIGYGGLPRAEAPGLFSLAAARPPTAKP